MVEKSRWQCGGPLAKATAVAFALFVVICVGIAITLIFTQKPVDIGAKSESAAWDSTNKSIRRKPTNYRPFTFDDLTSQRPHVKSYYFSEWLADDSLLLMQELEADNPLAFLWLDDASPLTILRKNSSREEPFIDAAEITGGFSSDHLLFSSNERYVAMYKTVMQGFRHSQDSIYQIAAIRGDSTNKTVTEAHFVGPKSSGNEIISDFKWNPNETQHDFVFVSKFNIYYQADPEKPGSAVKITENGNQFYKYGNADWLYEEEIFSSANALWWSPSGDLISYMRFDDQYVSRVYVAKYYPSRQYADYMEVPYPKAGVTNQPMVTLFLWNKVQDKKVVISAPDELEQRNMSYYIISNTWITVTLRGQKEERLLTVWSDREQMNIYITLCSVDDCILTYSQSFTLRGRELWAEPADFQDIYSSSTGFFILLPHHYTDGNIYNHIAHIRVQDDGTGRVTTFHGGTFDISRIYGYDPIKDALTYETSGGGIAYKRFYRILNASTRLAQTTCISCILQCDTGTISVSPHGTRAAITCRKAFANAKLYVVNTTNPNDFQQVRGFEEAVLSFDPPKTTFEAVKLSSGIEAHIGMMLPPKFDPSETYPVLLEVYGGPNSYKNSRETPWDFLVYLCTTRQIVVMFVDGRGSKHRGWNVKEQVRYNLGPPEADDQIEAMRKTIQKYSYLNKDATAVFGWSYGGFLSTHIAVRDQGHTFRCAIAVAPVADFLMYDSAYTERYMGLPVQNPKGYNISKLTDKMENMRNVHYMLVHGSSDDNVHYQHSALLAGALQEKQILFHQLVYTNQDHSMGPVRPHLYKEVTHFLDSQCFSDQSL